MPALIGTIDWNTQTQFPQLTPEAYRRIFQNSPVMGGANADRFYDLINQEAQRVGLAPSFLAAIIAQETGAGRGYHPTTGAEEAIIRNNNPGGLMSGSRHLDFATIEEGLRSTAENAANNWIREANATGTAPTVQGFRERWAPSRAPNDPRNLNQFWTGGVERFLGNMGNAAFPWQTPENLNWIIPQTTESVPYTGQDADPTNWHGDTGEEIGPNTGLDFTAPLPYAGTGLTGQSLQDWIASPTGGQQVAGLSTQGGYTLPEGVVDFVGRVAPELGGGPQAFPEGNFPWFTPGRISGEEGAILQHHALMPNNLVFDPEALNWRVPDPSRGDAQRFPGASGIWGAQTVADWLPGAATGFGRDYLTHLGYGAEHNAGGLSNTYYGAPNLYGAPNAGVLGNWWGQTPGINTAGMGNGGFGNIADMSTYNHQPFDWSQYLPGPSTHQPDQVAPGGDTFADRFGTWPASPAPATMVADTSSNSIIQSGGPGYGAAQNPIFAGMYYSQVSPTIWSGPPTPQIYNSGIGPGGGAIAPGINTTPIMTYNMGPGGIPLALGY